MDKMEGLYREEGGTRRLLAKERKACFQPGHLLTGRDWEMEHRVFIMQMSSVELVRNFR